MSRGAKMCGDLPIRLEVSLTDQGHHGQAEHHPLLGVEYRNGKALEADEKVSSLESELLIADRLEIGVELGLVEFAIVHPRRDPGRELRIEQRSDELAWQIGGEQSPDAGIGDGQGRTDA
ncbi:MAG: hypothetical protein Q8Q88_11255, partial [Phenylobacterium sp.]